MNNPVMQTIDITGASYSASLLALAGTAILLLLGTGWVTRGWKIPVALAAVALGVSAFGVLEARQVWLATGEVPLVYHYVGWIVSIPALLIATFFSVRQVGVVANGLFWRLLVTSVLMVLFRYLGEAGFVHPTLAFLIGLAFWLYILGELFFGQLSTVVSKSMTPSVKRGYFWLRLIVTVGWAIYPLANFIISFSDYVDAGGMSTAYALSDLINRVGFGLALLAMAVLASQESDHA